MEEPSVLDYLKSKLFFWRGEVVEIPLSEAEVESRSEPPASVVEAPSQPVQETVTETVTALEAAAEPRVVSPEGTYPGLLGEEDRIPEPEPLPDTLPVVSRGAIWRVLLALVLALLAQRTLEPPRDSSKAGVVLYLLAVTVLVWASVRDGWSLGYQSVEKQGSEPLTLRRYALYLSIPLAILAFIFFGGNRFTIFNVVVWALALLAFLGAFWLFDPQAKPWYLRTRIAIQRFFTRGATFSPWTLLVLAVFALAAFFRFYQLEQVPVEMFSDHAEKLLDVADVLDGETSIFFPRNTGREAFQMYLTAAVALVFNTGLSFISLKIGTALAGLFTLPYIYLLGKEIGGRRVGLIALAFAGIAYWPNVIARVALRFALYPLFTAPTLYYLIRGLRRRSRNDFLLAGVALGLGLHGYSPFRFVPFVVVAAVGLYLLHRQSKGARKAAVIWLVLLAFTSLIIFLPLLRYAISDPEMFTYRTLTRMSDVERSLPGPAWEIFFENMWKSLTMFFWDDGEIWVHSVTHRPALSIVSAALFFLGFVLLFIRYFRKRNWLDIFLIVSIPLLMMPSILSLAFPAENPSLNRSGGAIIPVFLVIGLALDSLMKVITARGNQPWRVGLSWVFGLLLLVWSGTQDYDLVFRQYNNQFKQGAWNTSELGAVIRNFADTIGDEERAWVVPYPHWVDTRLVGINAGVPLRDYACWPDQISETKSVPGSKLFLYKPEDETAIQTLRELYPQGLLSMYDSPLEGKDFMIYLVPAQD
jgi:hypothetical protein